MAGLIPQSFIDELLDRIDIVDVVDSRVKLKKTGKNYSACCPFHDEKSPSFTVSPDKQFYYCFGCGASGSALGFILDYERLNFPDAVEELAKMAGLEVPREARNDSPAQQERKSLYKLLEQADQFFQLQLRHSPAKQHAVNYLQGRGLTGAIARDFGIGYAPPGWDNLLKSIGLEEHDRHLLVEGGMVISRPEDNKRYDRFRNRIMFPIRDARGRVIGFGGRVLGDDKPKYLNSPETPVFHKGRELYGLHEARQAHKTLPRLLVVEGYMDVVAMAQFGIRYAVATLGTACGEDHLTLAFKYANEIVFCFDGDKAGRTAAKRGLENSLPVMQDGRQIKFLFLPDGEDPDTLVRQVGEETFTRMIEQAVPLEDFLFDSVAEDIDLTSMEGRARLSKRAAPLLHKLPKGVYQQLMFANLAQRTGLPVDTLMELVEPAEPFSPPLAPPPAASPTARPAVSAQLQQASSHHSNMAEDPGGYDDYGNHYQGDHSGAPMDAGEYETADYYQGGQDSSDTHSPPLDYSSPQPQGNIKLSARQLLNAQLLQHPELAAQTQIPPLVSSSELPELILFRELFEFLQSRPSYTRGQIIGHWSGTKSEQETAKLHALAEIELLSEAKQTSGYNAAQAFIDTLQKVEQQLQNEQQLSSIDALKRRSFGDLSDAEKQKIRDSLVQAR